MKLDILLFSDDTETLNTSNGIRPGSREEAPIKTLDSRNLILESFNGRIPPTKCGGSILSETVQDR